MKKIVAIIFFAVAMLSCASKSCAQDFAINHGPYLQAVGENEATIVWTTTRPAVSWVEMAPAGKESFYAEEHTKYFETKNGNRVVNQLHKIHIAGLEKGTEYRYRIFSKEVTSYEGKRVIYGKIACTDVFRSAPLRFATSDSGKDRVSFSMVCDIHAHADTLRALLKDIRYGTTDMVFFNGDMVSSVESEQQFFDGFMQPAIDLFAKEVPVFYTRGNHETRGKFSAQFTDYFASNSGKLYYSFRQGPVFFIVLDGGEDKPDSDIEYSELACFDQYRTEQQHWLDQVLKTPECLSAAFRVVIIHIPPYGTDWHGARDIREKFVPLLNKARIDVMLCGHMHSYSYIEPIAGKLNFPILINAANTRLDVTADKDNLIIKDMDTKGVMLNSHDIKRH
jgi:Icc-related predicted phosphoesterase